MPLSAFQCAAIYLLLRLPYKVLMCLTLLWTYYAWAILFIITFFYFSIVATTPKLSRVGIFLEPNPGSRNARSVWELCNERTKNGNLWPKTDPCFFLPPAPPPAPHRAHRFGFFSALRVQKEAGRGSWVSGWWAAFVAAPSSCLAFVPCFVQIEKCYVFSHHFSLPGQWSS